MGEGGHITTHSKWRGGSFAIIIVNYPGGTECRGEPSAGGGGRLLWHTCKLHTTTHVDEPCVLQRAQVHSIQYYAVSGHRSVPIG